MKNYWSCGIDEVEGWLSQGIEEPLTEVDRFQREAGILGSVMEIGVHQGKFFIPLALLKRPEEYALGIDLFEDQARNIDFSGMGGTEGPPTVETCRRHIFAFAENPEAIHLMSVDSLTLGPLEIADLLRTYPRFAFTSIDGGHTALHLSIDFMTASQLTSPVGVIAVDDLFHPDWPGVTEGIFRVLGRKESPFIPLFITRKKAFFCHASVQTRFVAFIAEQFSARYTRDVRYVDFFGWRVPSLNFGNEY